MLRSRRYYLGSIGVLGGLQFGKALAGGVIIGEGIINFGSGGPPPPPPTCPGTNVRTAFGAVGDGITDDTAALRAAGNSGQTLYFPITGAFYKTTGVVTLTNSACSDGAEIRILQDSTVATSVFKVDRNAAPMTISGFTLNGLYGGGTAGEASMGIELRSAHNVTIDNNTIKNCYGDNIYCGWSDGTIPCTNITITNNTLTNPRRILVTVIYGDGILMQNNTMHKIVDYVTGIDLEPNNDGVSYVRNVTIDGNNITCPGSCIENCCDFTGDPGAGIVVKNNIATGVWFYAAISGGQLTNPLFSANQFTCTNPATTSPRHASMFTFRNVTNASVINNIDHTVAPGGSPYHSLDVSGSTFTQSGNTFIP